MPLSYSQPTIIINTGLLAFSRSASVNTTGPWVEVLPSIQLRDISIQIDQKYQEDGCIAVWAVSLEGDVLRRNGVTAALPQVSVFSSLSVLNCSSERSSKDNLLLIQCYHGRKLKLN